MNGSKFNTPNTFFDLATAIELVHSGSDYFERLKQLIANAQKELHIQTYIFNTDETGNEIIEELIRAAERNVKVYVLVDAYGSSSFNYEAILRLQKMNIKIRFFAPVFSYRSIHFGRRLHHKIAVADENIAIVGGINIANKYKGSNNERAWLDYAIQIQGTACKKIQAICNDFFFYNRLKTFHKANTNKNVSDGIPIRIKRNDWLNYNNEIGRTYLKAIKSASSEVIIVGSYFLPGRRFRKSLKDASNRGVKVKIILAGISDVPLIKNATSFFYSYLLRNNIEIYEWKKSVLHGKAAVVDETWSTIGSYNINRLSKYSSIEMNIEIHLKEFSTFFTAHLHQVLDECEQIQYQQYEAQNSWLEKFKNWVSFWVVRMLSNILTTFTYKRVFRDYFNS